jgi:hypothetical protein
VRDAAEKLTAELPEKEQLPEKPDDATRVSAIEPPSESVAFSARPPERPDDAVAAAQPEASDEDGDVVPIRRRTHGGALPS